MTSNPIVSTEHVARYFTHRGSPHKRASEALLKLEQQKIIEGRRRAMGEAKIWRLTKKGREEHNITRQPVSFTSNKVGHYLAIASVYQDLKRIGELKRWAVELRETFGTQKYCPDIFTVVVRGGVAKAFLIEVQESPLTSTRWGEKWAVASAFFDSEELKTASFQVVPGKIIRPQIVALSSQQPETVQGASRLPIIIAKDIKSVALF